MTAARRSALSATRSVLVASCCAGALFAATSAAAAGAKPIPFDISGGDLAGALNQFAQQSDHQIFFATEATRGKQVGPIRGVYAPDRALALLLKGSGLAYQPNENGAIIVKAAAQVGDARPAAAVEPRQAPPPRPTPAAAPETTRDAASAVQEVVVTAQRRQELSRDVPITITTLGADQITQAGAVQLSDIARLTPGLRFDSTTGFVQPTIRGIGTAVSGSGGGSNVGIYVDGFYMPNPGTSNLELIKLQSVQVLKGPQGTLFGRNTTGGAILVTTTDPSIEPGGMAEVSYGRFNSQRARGYVTAGLTDHIAVDLEGQYRKSDGFVTNIVDGDDKIGRYKNWNIRAGVKADLSENVSVLLRYAHTDADNPADNMSVPFVTEQGDVLIAKGLIGSGLYTTNRNEVAISQPVGYTSKSDTVQGTVKADLGFADLTSYTQWRKDKTSLFNDFDFTAAPLFFANLLTESKAISQEFLLTSKPGGPLQWTVGAFYFQSREKWDFFDAGSSPFFKVLSNGTFTRSYAAFADATYEFTPQIFLTVGARFSHDTVPDAWFTTTNPVNFGQRFDIPSYKSDRVTPRVVLRYKPSDQSSIYASYTRGYKAGILNVGGEQFTPVKPETIAAYEAGYKYDDRALAFDVSAFYYDYKNLQVSNYFNTSASISNAASSKIYGLDSQVRYRFVNGFELNAGAAYTKSEYKRFNGAPSYVRCGDTEACAGLFQVQPINIVNGVMQRSPKFTANAGVRYPIDLAGGKLVLSSTLYYTSSFFFDTSEQFRQKAYEVVSLRAQWTDPSERYTLAVYGDNVTGSRYRTQLFYNNLGIGNSWSAPTTYGVSLGVKF